VYHERDKERRIGKEEDWKRREKREGMVSWKKKKILIRSSSFVL
jgi:hypothetical protein